MRFFVRFRERYESLNLFIEIAFRLIMFFYQQRYLLQPDTHTPFDRIGLSKM